SNKLASDTIPTMSAASWPGCAGAASARWAARWSAMRGRSRTGKRSAGRTRKKSRAARPHYPLHRRKRPETKASPRAPLGAARPDAGAGVRLQLEEPFGHRRADLVELLLRPSPRQYQDPAG